VRKAGLMFDAATSQNVFVRRRSPFEASTAGNCRTSVLALRGGTALALLLASVGGAFADGGRSGSGAIGGADSIIDNGVGGTGANGAAGGGGGTGEFNGGGGGGPGGGAPGIGNGDGFAGQNGVAPTAAAVAAVVRRRSTRSEAKTAQF
jgi:hypothetical protein